MPVEIAREFRFISPTREQLQAIGRDHAASAILVASLDWMTAIIWPFAHEDVFPLQSSEAPERVMEFASTLRTLGADYHPPGQLSSERGLGAHVQQAADLLVLNLERWLGFEEWAIDEMLPEEPLPRFPGQERRRERLESLSSLATSERIRDSGVDVAARLVRVSLDRARSQFWTLNQFSFPGDVDGWSPVFPSG